MNTKHRQASKAKRGWQTNHASFAQFTRRFTPADVANIVLPPRVAFECMRNGQGTTQDFATLADTINVALAHSRKIDELHIETCNLAINGLLRTHERYLRIGRYVFDGPALQEIAMALDLFQQIVQQGNPQELIDAINAVKKEIRAGNFHDLEGVVA